MQSVLRSIKFALQSIFRNFWLSLVTTSVLFLTLLTVNMLVSLNVLANSVIASIEEDVQVVVYFNSGASEEIQMAVRGYLSALPEVREVRVVPAEVSLENFKQQHQDDPDILAAIEEVGANPIGDSLEISAQHPEDFDFILKALDTSPEFAPYIREKSFANHQAVIDQLSAFNNKVRWGGLVLATFFALISILIVFNTIRVAIYVHRDEIAVMKLVGAKDWFIRSPFLLESILYSAAATAVVAGVMALLLNFFDPKIRLFFAGIDVDLPGYYWQHVFSVFGLQFVLLAILTMITTTLAMRRYLRT